MTIETRTTKEIIEGIVRNANKYSFFEYKYIYKENTKQMFYCVKTNDSKHIYEVKVTRKVAPEGVRIVADGEVHNKDPEKQEFLYSLKKTLDYVFKKVSFHGGNVLVSDNNNDYLITMVKKVGLEWK